MSEKPSIPFHNFGGKGKVIHFAHANGYPPEGYKQFVQPFLDNYEIIASKYRPLWGDRNPNEVKHWNVFADDLIRFMDEKGLTKVIGMGHSMGGTISSIAAMKRPDLFEQLVLIDPVIFPKTYDLWTKFLPNSFLKRMIPIAKASLKRRDQWESKQEVYHSWRKKRVFKKFSDSVLKDFIDAAIVPSPKGGVTLAYPKAWETQVYVTAPYIFSDLVKIQIPLTVIKGEHSNVITDGLWEKWQQKQPNAHLIEYKSAGHLVPMEYPILLADTIMKQIKVNAIIN